MLVCVGECLAEFAPTEDGSYRLNFAGDTYNAAWAAHVHLRGALPVRYATAIGTDWVSDMMLSSIAEAGIDTAFMRRIPDSSVGLYVIRVENGERSFAYWRRQSAATRLADDLDFLRCALEGAKIILISGITVAILTADRRALLREILQEARGKGAEVAFDPNFRPALWRDHDEARAEITRFLGIADIALPTFDDEKNLFGDETPGRTVERIAALGVRDIVVKNGTEPTICRFGPEDARIPLQTIEQPVDSTGAGDAFNGAFLAWRLMRANGTDAVAHAHEAAARAVLTRGALIPRLPD
ncbi:MAG TPA: sugar kinase [Acidiphilium sp.]